MGLSLKPLGNILHAIETPVVDVGKAIGDIGSYGAAYLTGNQQAQANASKALGNAFAPVANIVEAPVRGAVGAGLGLGTGAYNVINRTNLTTPQILQNNPNPLASALDTYATNHNTKQNLGKATAIVGNAIQPIATAAFGPAEGAIEKGLLSKGAGSLLAKGGARVGAGTATAAGFGGGQALTAPNPTVGSVAGGAAEGGVIGGITGGLSMARPVVKALRSTPDIAVDAAKLTDPVTTANLEQAGQQAAQATPPAEPTPAPATLKGMVAAPKIPPSNVGIPEIDNAINDIANLQSKPTEFSGTAQDVVNKAGGVSTVGQRASNDLGKALSGNLTKAENQAVEDFLDGHPTDNLTPKALKVANALQPIRSQALAIRTAIDPKVGEVAKYSPRIPAKSLTTNSTSRGDSVLGKIRSLADIHNLASSFSKERLNDKFVGSKGTLIGSSKDLGLTDEGNGVFKDANGQVFKRLHATKQELTDAGQGNYERKTSAVNRIYHSDTLSLKARGEAIQALNKDPNSYGLYTEDQVARGEGPKNAVPVTKVKGLTDANGGILYGSKGDVKALEDNFGFKNAEDNPALQAYDAATNVVTKAIVLNPLFHGMNQLYQTAIAAGNLPGLGNGWLRVAKGVLEANEQDIRDMLEHGGHSPTYGADMENILSKVTGGTTKLPSKGMAAIEIRLRAGLYKASVDSGMAPKAAVKNIDTFLGDNKAINETVRRTVLFAHYFKTMSKAMGTQIAHPIENMGANINAATLAALTAAASYGYQQFTGNPNAQVRLPGELGLAKQVFESGKQVASGELPSVVTNRINPVAKEIGQQTFNKDLFTKQPIGNAKNRLSHAAGSLLAPVEVGGKVTAGKRSVAETTANELGLTTPHAKGYQAAPNFNGKVPFNTKGAIISKTGDPTGYKQQQAYFKNLNTLKSQFSGDKATTDALNLFLDRSHDPATGQTIQQSPAAKLESSGALATNPKLLAGVQKFEKSQPQHDPKWDLSPDRLATYETYEAMLEGSAERSFIKANQTDKNGNNWISDLTKAENNFYNNLPHTPGSKPPETNGPAYPVFDKQTQDLLSQYDQASPDDRIKLIQANGGELASAFDAIAKWSNQQRQAQTGKSTPLLNTYPEAPAGVQKIIDTYNAIPKGGGKHGGNLFRAQWIQANPDAYAQMQTYLAKTSMYSLVKNAALDQFQGASPNQQLLKDIKNVGQYDIATTKNADGTTSYSINPPAASAQSSSSSDFSRSSKAFSSLKASVKLASQERDLEHAAKAARRVAPKNHSYPKRDKVFIKGTPKVTQKKIALPGVTRKYTPSIKLKHSPSGNKVRLKVK